MQLRGTLKSSPVDSWESDKLMNNRKKIAHMNSRSDNTFHPFEIAFCGYSNSGKTRLISRLVSQLSRRFTIGYYKHGCHSFDIDRQGKDSSIVRESGASIVMLSDPQKHALIGSFAPDPLLTQTSLLAVDMLMVEGLKELPLPKIIVVDKKLSILELIHSKAVTHVVALVAPEPAAIPDFHGYPIFHRDNIDGIADFIVNRFLGIVSGKPAFGLVLAGGKSRRMGADKALLTYHTRNQLIHTAEMMGHHCQKVYFSCRAEQEDIYRDFGFPLITDSYLDIGPLGGLLSAQREFPETSWLVCACDLPFIDHALLHELVRQRDPFAFATSYRHKDTKAPEPLCTIYEPKSRLPLILRHGAENNSLRSFLQDFPIHYLSVKDPLRLQNINTPEEQIQASRSLSEENGKKRKH